MLLKISEKSKKAFEKAAKKLKLSTELPNLSMIREDLALYLTAQYMLSVIIEAGKNGKVYDITNHDNYKYWPWHIADEGYEPGSSGGGFSFGGCVIDDGTATVGARLSSNSSNECRQNAEDYPDLWEIVVLNVR